MAFSPEEKSEMQAMILDTVGALVKALQGHLDDQHLERQADVDLIFDKLDRMDMDVKATRVQVSKLSRERFKEVRQHETIRERQLSALTEIEKLKFSVGKLIERLDSLEQASGASE